MRNIRPAPCQGCLTLLASSSVISAAEGAAACHHVRFPWECKPHSRSCTASAWRDRQGRDAPQPESPLLGGKNRQVGFLRSVHHRCVCVALDAAARQLWCCAAVHKLAVHCARAEVVVPCRRRLLQQTGRSVLALGCCTLSAFCAKAQPGPLSAGVLTLCAPKHPQSVKL